MSKIAQTTCVRTREHNEAWQLTLLVSRSVVCPLSITYSAIGYFFLYLTSIRGIGFSIRPANYLGSWDL